MQAGFALLEVGFCRAKNAAHTMSMNIAVFGTGAVGFFLYMLAFMDTAATIPTGSMAERWKFKSFVAWGFVAGALYYPLFGAWTWGGG